MKPWRSLTCGLFAALCGSVGLAQYQSLHDQNETLLRDLQRVHGLSDSQMKSVRGIFTRSGYVGQGNPAITRHPVTPEACQEKLKGLGVSYDNPSFEKICGGKFMAPLYDPSRQRPEQAKACIDQFEFPDIPCAYPVVWVKAREAAEVCAAEGKRLCDAHEWEGACEGSLGDPDYRFDLAAAAPDASTAAGRMRAAHNQKYGSRKSWSYGPAYRTGVCGTSSQKSADCEGDGWKKCGSNTFPDGNFPECRSPLQVYDLNGNAAEHMNLPLNESQMSSRGSRELGVTEMKGSWFVFDKFKAHEDWCRWRAPYWHGGRVMDEHSHANYHLGFRCCKSLD
jgi:formylglycine-generating enzyme required for sulfatase activity